MNDLLSRLTSRKFLLAVFVAVVAIFNESYFHLTPDQISLLQNVIIAFIGAEGIADAVTRYTNIPTVDEEPAKGKK